MKKNTKAKPTGPVEDTVFYRFLNEEGVGVYSRVSDNPMMPHNVIIRPIAAVRGDNPTKFVDNLMAEISIGVSGMVRCSAAYVYGWQEMQKNLFQYRTGKKYK